MYLCETELFEIELIFCLKIDLALNNLQRLICHKPKQRNNQSGLHDSSQYSGRSKYCSCLDGLHSSYYFQVSQSL